MKLIAQTALHAGADVEKIKRAKAGSHTIEEAIAISIATIGENMNLRRAAGLSVSAGALGAYMHNSVVDGLGKIGVLVALESKADQAELAKLARNLAMHVAASNPLAVDPAGLATATIERERAILADKAKAAGKPSNVIEKIVESGLKTFYKEACLIDQVYVHDPAKSVGQAVKEAESRLKAPIAIKGFVRYALGEGIEKQEADFAAEVAAAARPN